MGAYYNIVKKTKLQEWTYDDQKEASNADMKDWYAKIGYRGNAYWSNKIDEKNKNSAYYQIGSGMIGVAFGYIMMWMAIILVIVFVAYRISHFTGGIH